MTTKQDPFFRFISVAGEKETYMNLLYLFLMFPLGIIYFIILITGLSLTMGFIVILIGIFIGIGLLLLVRGISSVHLFLASALLGFKLPAKNAIQATDRGFIEKLKKILADAKTYTSMLYMLIEFPLGIFYFTVFITLLSLSISLVATPLLWFIFEEEYIYFSGNDWLLNLAFEEALLMIVGGLFLFFVTLHLGKILARVEEVLCKNLLMSRFQIK